MPIKPSNDNRKCEYTRNPRWIGSSGGCSRGQDIRIASHDRLASLDGRIIVSPAIRQCLPTMPISIAIVYVWDFSFPRSRAPLLQPLWSQFHPI